MFATLTFGLDRNLQVLFILQNSYIHTTKQNYLTKTT